MPLCTTRVAPNRTQQRPQDCCRIAPISKLPSDRTLVRKLFSLSRRYYRYPTLKAKFTITSCRQLLMDAREVSVRQLQLLVLKIPTEDVAVPMDATARTELIDLMARILVVIFQAEGGTVDDRDTVQSQFVDSITLPWSCACIRKTGPNSRAYESPPQNISTTHVTLPDTANHFGRACSFSSSAFFRNSS